MHPTTKVESFLLRRSQLIRLRAKNVAEWEYTGKKILKYTSRKRFFILPVFDAIAFSRVCQKHSFADFLFKAYDTYVQDTQ